MVVLIFGHMSPVLNSSGRDPSHGFARLGLKLCSISDLPVPRESEDDLHG